MVFENISYKYLSGWEGTLKSSEIFELLTKDDTKARNQFTDDFRFELGNLSNIFSEAFSLLNDSDCAKEDSHRTNLVSRYLYLAVESAVTAVQLLSTGHIAPAGNSMRISYESLCMATLLKTDVQIQIANGKHVFNFYDEFKKKTSNARADKALNLVIKNKEALGLNEEDATFLKVAKNFYNSYSHASDILIHSKVKPSTSQLYVGGGYDLERINDFKIQIDFITRYSKNLSSWITAVAYDAA